MTRNPIIGGSLTLKTPYNGRAQFDWWLDAYGHDVIVECMSPYKGLSTNVHQMCMAPRFSHAQARQLAERLCQIIINNSEFVILHRNDADLKLANYYDNRQLPLYKECACKEEKRRLVEVRLLAKALRDDEDDAASKKALSTKQLNRAKKKLRSSPLKVIREAGPFTYEELKKKWRLTTP